MANKRLTDLDEILPAIAKIQASDDEPNAKVGKILIALTDAPTVDAVEVVHGRWKRRGRKLGECSECGEIVLVRYPYCPNCGAKMDGGADNG
jgi:hypothetical protein